LGRERDVDDFVAAKASDFNKSQQLSMSGVQQIQYELVKKSRIPQRSIGDRIWFGPGAEVQILSPRPSFQKLTSTSRISMY
jgi:hypothetical protein